MSCSVIILWGGRLSSSLGAPLTVCLGRSLSVVHHTLGLRHQGPRCWSRYAHTQTHSHTRLNCSHQATSINHLCLWSSDCPQTQTHTHLLIHWGVCVAVCMREGNLSRWSINRNINISNGTLFQSTEYVSVFKVKYEFFLAPERLQQDRAHGHEHARLYLHAKKEY